MTGLRLRPLRVEDEAQAVRAHAELSADGFEFLQGFDGQRPWSGYVAWVDGWRCGLELPGRFVPSVFLVAEVDGEIVGRVSIRLELTEWLLAYGGHVGYGVRPAYRRRGFATEILRQALVVARAEGVQRVLVTCDDDNAGSATAIERCGGVLEDLVDQGAGKVGKRRYWFD